MASRVYRQLDADKGRQPGDTITIRRSGMCWMAEYSGPHAARVELLFNTTSIPLPYALSVSAEYIQSHIAAANGGVVVLIAEVL